MFETLLYPQKMKPYNLPKAELLSIAVAPEGRGMGIARQLIMAGFDECRNRGIDSVKVLVADFNIAAGKLYQKAGFGYVGQIDNHGVVSNIHVISLADRSAAESPKDPVQ